MVAEKIKQANKEAIDKLLSAQPTLVGIGTAGKNIPGMTKKTILHAGPPITWEKMSGPLRGAVIGGLIYEGLAANEEEAIALASSGEITYDPCHHRDAVGPMAGVTTYSMPVWIVENKPFGNFAYCTLNEGLGKVLRYGAFSEEVITRLKWMEELLAPVLAEALELSGEIDLKTMIAQVLQMGDEGHNRNKAGTSLLIRELAPYIVNTSFTNEEKSEVLKFMHSNGTEFGIRVAGLGDQWFTGPAEIIDGLYFPGYSTADANPDIGDSAITETSGIGGFAMAAAIPIVQFVGGTPQDAINYSKSMYEITEAENNAYKIPVLDFRGTATGIDIQKVIETGIRPIINTGIAHKDAGIGQVGAGLVHPPMKCFEDALEAFIEKLEEAGEL